MNDLTYNPFSYIYLLQYNGHILSEIRLFKFTFDYGTVYELYLTVCKMSLFHLHKIIVYILSLKSLTKLFINFNFRKATENYFLLWQ